MLTVVRMSAIINNVVILIVGMLSVFAPTRVKHLSGTPLQDGLLALPASIRLGWKSLPRTNTLAYYKICELRIKKFHNIGPYGVNDALRVTNSDGSSIIGPRSQNFLALKSFWNRIFCPPSRYLTLTIRLFANIISRAFLKTFV